LVQENDCWYFCKSLTSHIELLKKDWVFQVKSNRLILVNDEWISVKKFAEEIFPDRSFKTAKIDDDTYLVKVFTVVMKNMGPVRLMILNTDHGHFKFFATNILDWNETKIPKKNCLRWDVEVLKPYRSTKVKRFKHVQYAKVRLNNFTL
jgi:hypothetical protein